MYTLLDNNVDYKATNSNGLNAIHVAAQGDQAATLYLFKQMGIDPNEPDNLGSTALHWSIYALSEVSLSYLLAMNIDVNAQDHQGMTALHLAVKNLEELGSTRIIKALIYKGADPSISDSCGHLPVDLLNDMDDQDPMYLETKLLLGQENNQNNFNCIHMTPSVKKV